MSDNQNTEKKEESSLKEDEKRQDQTGAETKEIKKKEPVKEKMIKIKESEHLKLVEEASDYRDRFIRLHAEFDNFRKRTEREKIEFVKYANEGTIIDFLSILDNLERSMEAAQNKHEDYDAFLKGIEMVMSQVYEMLKRHNVKPIEAKGKQFDPHLHEALMQIETDEFDEGIVVEEFQKGYLLADRVVRTAKVKVAKKKEQTQVESKEQTESDLNQS